ncbi:cytochrome P450 [Dactylosporangium sp. CS-033363]|uniref:cytochrome P450 n=1 Tax=Dactylosporangium sp. CS-033363 TaxID=3239935 RepID=UPI003D8DB8AC
MFTDLPGLALADRAALFTALRDLDARCTADVVPVTLGGRPGRFVREPEAARAVLTSPEARKGRPAASLRDLGGYIGLTGSDFAAARADVIAALRASSADGPTDLVAHLAGTAPDLTAAFGALRRIADAGAEPDTVEHRAAAVAQLAPRLSERSAFVRVLTERGWDRPRIAAEIVTLAFAGRASLGAATRSGRCLGITGGAATDAAVTELFRIAAPGWLVVREYIEDGTLVVLSPWLLHRDPRGWRDPGRFDPDRTGTRRSPWYLPFSAGPRRCPAETWSRAYLRATLGQLPPSEPAATTRTVLAEGRSACLEAEESA